MRRLRERKRKGVVVLQGIEIQRKGVELLIARGWLDAKASDDPVKVRAALVKLINGTLLKEHSSGQFRQRSGP
jgi:hypothetical protein